MKIVEVWCKTKSLNGTFDVLFDVRGRVRDIPIATEDIEATF